MADLLFPHHKLSVNATIGALHLSAAFELSAPWTVIYGPSGSGKTSILRAACGLLPASATVKFERRTSPNPNLKTEDLPSMVLEQWENLSARPTHHRDLAYAPQQPALFPHLKVRDNIRFPYKVCADPPKQSILIDEALRLFSLHALANRMPRDLSGGEARRVALARAFATPNACLLLLDEPFSGLDRTLRDALLPGLQQALAARNLPVLSVTHDVDEALLLNAHVIRLDQGRLIAQGPAPQVLADERTRLLQTLC